MLAMMMHHRVADRGKEREKNKERGAFARTTSVKSEVSQKKFTREFFALTVFQRLFFLCAYQYDTAAAPEARVKVGNFRVIDSKKVFRSAAARITVVSSFHALRKRSIQLRAVFLNQL